MTPRVSDIVSTPAVFLDRDGTLIEDVGYVDRLERLQMYPFSVEAVRLLRRVGYAVVVVTNQAGVARGMVAESMVQATQNEIQRCLNTVGERLDGHYYCPHLADAPVAKYRRVCTCQKPQSGMVTRAARELDLDLTRSVVIGDRWSDVALAGATGSRGILVKTGYGASQALAPPAHVVADAVVDDLFQAVGWVLRELPRPASA